MSKLDAAPPHDSPRSGASALANFIPPALRGLIARRELDLGRAIRGQRHGPHASRRAGPGREFLEHRAYMPGDDPRTIDWRAMGRRDRWVVRRTESEDEFGVLLLLDTSAGMRFFRPRGGERGASKLEAALALAATVAELARRRRDPVGFAFSGGGHQLVPATMRPRATPQRSQALAASFSQLRTVPQSTNPGALPACDWASMLGAGANALRRPSLVLAFSDMLDPHFDPSGERHEATQDTARVLGALASLRARGHIVGLVQVLHAAELDFVWGDDQVHRFVDLNGRRPDVEGAGASLREHYLEQLNAHLGLVESQCEREGLIHVRARVGDSAADEPDRQAALGEDLAPSLTQLLDRIAQLGYASALNAPQGAMP